MSFKTDKIVDTIEQRHKDVVIKKLKVHQKNHTSMFHKHQAVKNKNSYAEEIGERDLNDALVLKEDFTESSKDDFVNYVNGTGDKSVQIKAKVTSSVFDIYPKDKSKNSKQLDLLGKDTTLSHSIKPKQRIVKNSDIQFDKTPVIKAANSHGHSKRRIPNSSLHTYNDSTVDQYGEPIQQQQGGIVHAPTPSRNTVEIQSHQQNRYSSLTHIHTTVNKKPQLSAQEQFTKILNFSESIKNDISKMNSEIERFKKI